MTQPQSPYPYPPYPSPYAPPQAGTYFGDPGDTILAPARRAAMLMFVLGGLIMLLGICNGAQALVVGAEEFAKVNERFSVPGGPPTPFSPETLRTMSLVMAGVTLFAGLAYVAVGAAVRRGSRGAAIGGIVLSVLAMLFALLVVAGSLLAAIAAPPMLACACGSLLPVSLFGLLIWWLVQSLRAVANWRVVQAQYQMQYWQYQQAAQAYGAMGGYGYGMPQHPTQQQAPSPAPSPDAPGRS